MGILYPDAHVKSFSVLSWMAPDSKAIFAKFEESLILKDQNFCE